MSATPIRIQLSRRKGWRMPENTVKVDRATPFGNPFAVRKGQMCGGGDPNWRTTYFINDWKHYPTKAEAMAESVAEFTRWIAHPANQKQRALIRVGLRGKNLACWCPLPAPGEPDMCHAAVLLRIANER